MRKLALALLLCLGLAPVQAQQSSWPPAAGSIAFLCVYNAVLPTITTGNAAFVQCDNHGQLLISGGGGGGGGLSVVDAAAFTYGVSPFTPGGGFYNSSITALFSGQQGAFALTANRDLHVEAVTGTNLATLLAAPVPYFTATAWNTNNYSNATTNPGNADLHGAIWADIGAINGVALLAGNGVTGPGSPRVTIASNNSPIPTTTGYAAAQLSTAAFDINSSGDNIVVTRAVGTIKVYSLEFSCATNQTTLSMKNGAGTVIGGPYYNVGTYSREFNAEPSFTTTSTNNFIINLAGATHCGGTVWYLDN